MIRLRLGGVPDDLFTIDLRACFANLDALAASQDDGALQDVLQLAHVLRPRMSRKKVDGRWCERKLATAFACVHPQKMGGQATVVAIGVTSEGDRQILGVDVGASAEVVLAYRHLPLEHQSRAPCSRAQAAMAISMSRPRARFSR